MTDKRYAADKATVIAAAAEAGIDLSADEIGTDPDTGVLTVDGMVWFEWLDHLMMWN